jgi:hypothetical protein
MTIEIDVTLMKKLNLTLNQYVFVFGLLACKKDTIKLTKQQQIITDADIQHLKTKGYITEESTLTNELENIHFTTEFKQKVASPENFFEEFFEIYPTSVTRPDGSKDYLKGNIKKCRDVYKKTVGNDEAMHSHIIQCLKAEIKQKEQQRNMRFMKKMYNWLSQEEWRIAEEIIKDNGRTNQTNFTGYGTDIA